MPAPKPPFQRLLEGYRVCESSGCWVWQGHTYRNGYGAIKCFGKMRTTHRFSYELHKGLVPKGKVVMHTCDNKLCINPDHLLCGTYSENSLDAVAKGFLLCGYTHPSYTHKKPPGIKNKLSKPVRVLGVMYSSQKEAEAALGLGRGTVRFWVKAGNGKAVHISREEYEHVVA